MADLPGGVSRLLVRDYRDYKGKNAARLLTRIDLGVVSLVAELRGPRVAGGRGTGPVEDRRKPRGPLARKYTERRR
jgi:hypothetical protein